MAVFDQLPCWDDPALAGALGWYRAVACGRRPARFLVAAATPTQLDPAGADEDRLWVELDRLTPPFLDALAAVRDGAPLAAAAAGPSLVDVCAALARHMLGHCNFCAWNCRVDRAAALKVGACRLGAQGRVSAWFRHRGEEAPLTGVGGSGAIFFTSCNMRCAFCQNGDISTDKDNGDPTDSAGLADMAWSLRLAGCHNVNWVGGDPTIHLHLIAGAIADLARRRGGAAAHGGDPAAFFDRRFNAPMLWNSNFFMTREAMRVLRPLIDIWLPDFKFGPGRCAIALARTPRYWKTVTDNLALVGAWGADMMVRHLVMPGHVACCTAAVFDWLAAHLPTAPVNVMDQYHPDNFCDPARARFDRRRRAMARRCTRAEIELAYDLAADRGLAHRTLSHGRGAAALRLWA